MRPLCVWILVTRTLYPSVATDPLFTENNTRGCALWMLAPSKICMSKRLPLFYIWTTPDTTFSETQQMLRIPILMGPWTTQLHRIFLSSPGTKLSHIQRATILKRFTINIANIQLTPGNKFLRLKITPHEFSLFLPLNVASPRRHSTLFHSVQNIYLSLFLNINNQPRCRMKNFVPLISFVLPRHDIYSGRRSFFWIPGQSLSPRKRKYSCHMNGFSLCK